MNFQDASNLRIPEGYVRTIHDKNNRLLWGSVGYDVTFDGNATQTTYSGINIFATSDSMWTGQSAGRVTYSAANDDFTFHRPAGADYLVANGTLALKPSTTYSIMFDVAQNTMTDAFRLVLSSSCIKSSTLSIAAGTTGKFYGKLVTTPSLTQTYDMWFYCNSTGTLKAKIMLVEGDYTAQTFPNYEPYTNGASPNPDYPQEIQTVTGENVVKVVGKNLAWTGWAEDFVTRVGNTARAKLETFDGKDCVWWRENTGYGDYDNKYIFKTNFQPNTQYTLSCDLYPSTNFPLITFKYTDGTSQRFEDITPNQWNHVVATSTAGKTVKYIQAAYFEGNVYCDIDTFQLELGSTVTAYEPYTAQDYEVNLGKNLLNLTDFAVGNMQNGNPVPTTKYRINNASSPITVKPNTSYTISANIVSPIMGLRIAVQECSADGTFIIDKGWKQLADTSYTFTTEANTGIVKLLVSRSTTSTTVTTSGTEDTTAVNDVSSFMGDTTLQFELGSKATSYSEYFTPLELAKIGTYQDRIYKNGEKWYVEKQVGKVVLDGSEDGWTFQPSNAPFRYRLTGSYATYDDASTFISDYFQSVAWNASWVNYDYLMSPNSGNNILVFRYTGVSTLADFKTWLSTHNTTVYYALANPTTTEITDATLIAQLEAVYDWVRRHGYNASVTGDLPIIINRTALPTA